jgi:hypothetical protein
MEHWKGYKLHADWADGEIPISCVLTSASVHDSQVAIPLATMSALRVTNLYDLMDAAYDTTEIRAHSARIGHISAAAQCASATPSRSWPTPCSASSDSGPGTRDPGLVSYCRRTPVRATDRVRRRIRR